MSRGADGSLEQLPNGVRPGGTTTGAHQIEIWLPEPSAFFELALGPLAAELERRAFRVNFRHQRASGEVFIRILAPDGAALRAATVIARALERLRARRAGCTGLSAVVLSPDGTQRELAF